MITFGQFIRRKRNEAGLTQTDLANFLGYASYRMVGMLENGERYWQFEHVIKLARLFDMQDWELVKEWNDS